MAKQTVDFTHAFKHRLSGASFSDSVFSSMAEGLGARLRQESQAGFLPFLTLPFKEQLEKDVDRLLPALEKFSDMLLLGIGGSALGAKALQKAFGRGQDRPGHQGRSLWVADNIDAATLNAWMLSLQANNTVVVVVSKSGTTIETMAQFFLVQEWLQKNLGEAWRQHLVFITDEKKGALREMSVQENIPALPVPDNLGGRYSIFSAVGMLPAAFLGMDYKALLAGAFEVGQQTINSLPDLAENPAFQLALWNCELMRRGYSELIFFSYIPSWEYLGPWFAQLWAESLGKQGQGSMPVPAVGVTDQHSINQMFLDGPRNKGCLFLSCPNLPVGSAFPDNLPELWHYLQGKSFGDLLSAEAIGTRMSLVEHAVPLVHLQPGMDDELALGKTMQLLMLSTILCGWLLGINPVDQPAVELGKKLANARLGDSKQKDMMEKLEAFLQGEEKSLEKKYF